MTLTTHVVVGCAVGLATGNPVFAFLGGIISHHLADSIPHSDLGSLGATVDNILKNRRNLVIVGADIALAAAIFLVVWVRLGFAPFVFWGAAGAVLPDLIDNSPFWSKYTRELFPTNYYHRFHEFFHFTIKNKNIFWLGIATQLVLITLSFYLIFLLK